MNIQHVGAIGLVVLDIRNPHFTNVVHGASLAAQAHGYNLIVADVKEDTSIATRTIDDLARRVDGLIFNMRLPDAIKDRQYYVPGDNKNEQAFAQYWKKIKGEL